MSPQAWPPVVEDTGWLNLSLASGASVVDGLTPQYRRKNGVVYLRGRVQAHVSTGVVGTLPSGSRIGQASRLPVMLNNSGTTSTVLIVGTDGALSGAAGAVLNIGSVSFPADG